MNSIWTFGDSYTAGLGCKFPPYGVFSIKNDTSQYYKTFSSYIDETKKIWPEIVAESLGFELRNFGESGISTETIFDNFIKNISNIKKDDIVIIQTSMASRWDFPFLKERTLFGTKEYKNEDCMDSPYRFKVVFPTDIQKEWDGSQENVLNYSNGQESYGETTLKLDEVKYNTIRNFFTEFISLNKYYERTIWRIVEMVKVLRNIGFQIYIINEDMWPMYLLKPSFQIEMHERGIYGYCASNKKTIFYDTNKMINDWHPSYSGHEMISNSIIEFIKNENTNIHNS